MALSCQKSPLSDFIAPCASSCFSLTFIHQTPVGLSSLRPGNPFSLPFTTQGRLFSLLTLLGHKRFPVSTGVWHVEGLVGE